MSQSPQFKVYDSAGEYQASCKEPHAAALLAEHYSGTVRFGHDKSWTVWKDGDLSPMESFDTVAIYIFNRVERLREAAKAQVLARMERSNANAAKKAAAMDGLRRIAKELKLRPSDISTHQCKAGA